MKGELDVMSSIPVIDMVATGQNIADMRRRAGISVHALQQIFGFSTPQAIYKWQHGTAMPTLDNLLILSEVFGTSMDQIIIRQSETICVAG